VFYREAVIISIGPDRQQSAMNCLIAKTGLRPASVTLLPFTHSFRRQSCADAASNPECEV
jgi:hypothetical protein